MESGLRIRRTLHILFFFSGFSALVYEILWTKYLSLTFGATIPAVSTIAATFMGGLALGSYLFGRYADKARNLLASYGLLELGIAISAALFPFGLNLVEKTYIAANQAFPEYSGLSSLIRFLLSVFLLLLPTTCMGGTLPVMSRYLAGKRPSMEVGKLYGINTLGAASGTLIAAFLFIPASGLAGAAYTAISISLLIALVSFGLAARAIRSPRPMERSEPATVNEPNLIGSPTRLFVLACAGLTGFFTLAYEILWTRVLLLYLGNTTYSFAIILSLILIGIALGGMIYARVMNRIKNFEHLFSVVIFSLGITVILSSLFYDQFSYLFYYANIVAQKHWWLISLFAFLIASPLILVPTILSGILLPAAVGLLRPGRVHTGEGVGTVVLFNTLGGIAGSLATGFFMIPLLGLQKSFLFLSLSNTALGLTAFLFFRLGRKSSAMTVIAGGCSLLIVLFAPPWDQKLMNAGVYYYAEGIKAAGGLSRSLEEERLLAVYEGSETTVAVKERVIDGIRALSINGKVDAGTGNDMATQILLAQLPLLVHPHPREALVIGLGSGITLGAAKEHTLERVDCAEISPGVVKASHFFEKENRSALDDPKVHLFIRDGRNMLLTNDRSYDVIISEPSNPWQTGNANLFTVDFYRLASSRLKEKGIFCQWIPLYDMRTEDIRIICKTFMQEFPGVMAFKGAGGDLLLLGSKYKLNFDYRAIQQRMKIPGVNASLADMGIFSPGGLIAKYYLYSESSLSGFARNAAINSDDSPRIEYTHNIGKTSQSPSSLNTRDALLGAKQRELLPLTNAGSSKGEIAMALKDLGESYFREGQVDSAKYFLQLADKYAGDGEEN